MFNLFELNVSFLIQNRVKLQILAFGTKCQQLKPILKPKWNKRRMRIYQFQHPFMYLMHHGQKYCTAWIATKKARQIKKTLKIFSRCVIHHSFVNKVENLTFGYATFDHEHIYYANITEVSRSLLSITNILPYHYTAEATFVLHRVFLLKTDVSVNITGPSCKGNRC